MLVRLPLMLAVGLGLALAAATSPGQAMVKDSRASRPHVVDEWGKRLVGLASCKTPRDLDCVEGLRVRTGGKWITPTLVREEIQDTYDDGLGPGTAGLLDWEYDSAAGERVGLSLAAVMSPRGTTRFGKDALDHGVLLSIIRQPDESHPWFSDPRDLDCTTGNVDTCLLHGVRLPRNDVVEVTARTSWLRNNGVSIFGLDPYVGSRLISGGARWTISARQVLVPQPRKWDETTPAEGWVPRLSFQIDHAGDGLHDSAFDPRCADFGAPWSTPNSAGAGRLRWREGQNSLDFQVFSAHLDPHGKPYRGDFTAGIPLKWLNCIAEKKLRPAYLAVEVISEDGKEQVATTSVRVRRGTVYVRAVGFTFSRPIIRLSTQPD